MIQEATNKTKLEAFRASHRYLESFVVGEEDEEDRKNRFQEARENYSKVAAVLLNRGVQVGYDQKFFTRKKINDEDHHVTEGKCSNRYLLDGGVFAEIEQECITDETIGHPVEEGHLRLVSFNEKALDSVIQGIYKETGLELGKD